MKPYFSLFMEIAYPKMDSILMTEDGIELVEFKNGKWAEGKFGFPVPQTEFIKRKAVQISDAYVLGRKSIWVGILFPDGIQNGGSWVLLEPQHAAELTRLGFVLANERMCKWIRLGQHFVPMP
jgi:hypothetical protein